ncbi:MAG TPA: helix-hairpin-helix domain-containing protein [Candidatus Merdiplasma excrementigallinarum]|uniref:Helix-hairpin-helix domain-containing protein n=1 Tax=Candidatus Merdiplasma excrementigallinarum TaxID=2840864 RepID=A0A9D1T7S3_9FIRM|nr:helix-hairpin-helix domain-containing protein [Candidatus Merdiplasma excrementigallinarum]
MAAAGCLLLAVMAALPAGCSSGPQLTVMEMEEASETGAQSETVQTEPRIETEPSIAVYVCGAVNCPGVYELSASARVYQAVEAAGGFRDDADQEWVNQAQFLQDGGKIRIYTRLETDQMRQEGLEEGSVLPEGQDAQTEQAGESPVNLNTATREELMTLPGIGEAKADAVIAYREENGGFSSPEEIMNISGIKEAVFSQIKDRITV